MVERHGWFEGVDTVLLRVRDVGEAEAWYRDRLGLVRTFADDHERLVVLDVGGAGSLTLWQRKVGEAPPGPGTAGTYPILRVSDARAVQSALRERGVRVGDLSASGGVVSFPFFDLDGNLLEACQVG